MVAPIYVLFAVFLIVPTIAGFYYALTDFSARRERTFVWFDNFGTIFQDRTFWIAMRNTVYIVVAVVPSSLVVSLAIAAVVTRRSATLRSFVRGSFYLPVTLSAVTLSLTWSYIFHPTVGVANYLLSLLGIEPVTWLGDARFALLSIIIILFTTHLGVPVVLYSAALGGVPETYYEAARLDGASSLQQFVHVSVPMIRPTTLYLLVTSTIGTFQVFVYVRLLTGGGPGNATQTLAYYLYERAFVYGDFGLASAVGVVLFAVVLLIAAAQLRLTRSDIEY